MVFPQGIKVLYTATAEKRTLIPVIGRTEIYTPYVFKAYEKLRVLISKLRSFETG